jgi:hypothetical protein
VSLVDGDVAGSIDDAFDDLFTQVGPVAIITPITDFVTCSAIGYIGGSRTSMRFSELDRD